MKRILVTILSILYMASATGATVHLHYCMGEFVNASLIHKEEHKCGKCGMKKTTRDNGCCKDEHKTIKTSDHQSAKVSFDIAHAVALAPAPNVWHIYTQQVYSTSIANKSSLAHAPPSVWRTCPIYIAIRNFRI